MNFRFKEENTFGKWPVFHFVLM